jgi:hypothetical protein
MADLIAMLSAAAGAVGGEYEIERSLRFNSADSAYLSRTPASAGDRQKFTWSGWVKRCATGADHQLMAQYTDASNRAYFDFRSSDTFLLFNRVSGVTTCQLETTQVFRDVSAWYHVVVAVDTTQATNTNRVKIYINGSQVTAFGTATYPNQNDNFQFNTATVHRIGSYDGAIDFFNGYMTEIHFIDGQQLTPSSFGETDETTGVWSPIRYAGTYGTNGFYLNFSDNTSTTTLGDDLSGNGNDWTLNNFSVAAGAGNDSLVDSPTRYGTDTGAGGEVRGNYCTLNPLDAGTNLTFSQGNLQTSSSTNPNNNCRGTLGVRSGKWYFEIVVTSGTPGCVVGIASDTASMSTNFSGDMYTYDSNGNKIVNGSGSAYGATWTTNDVIGVAFDADALSITFYKNNSSQGAITGITSGLTWRPFVHANNVTVVANFGQRPFAHTAPSGFKALVTTNLPDPTVVQGDDYFNTVLYTGTGSSLGVTGVGFQPDWVWIKERNGAADHGLYDAVRGVQNQLESNTTTAETAEATGLTAFGTDGFTVGALAQLNTSADTYVAWNWKANGAGVSNTDGTITSTVSVNTTSGFSIVTYSGNSTDGATVGHGLGSTPKMIIVKNRGDGTRNWAVYHSALGATQWILLNLTNAAASDPIWADTAPTSSVFYLNSTATANTTSNNYVAYCFAEVEGFSKFGSYTGNGSTDGTFVYTGFRPAFILVKNTAQITNWFIWDNKTDPYNPASVVLLANTDTDEVSSRDIDILSNGFKARKNDQNYNSTDIMIYMAFASNPFKISLAR